MYISGGRVFRDDDDICNNCRIEAQCPLVVSIIEANVALPVDGMIVSKCAMFREPNPKPWKLKLVKKER